MGHKTTRSKACSLYHGGTGQRSNSSAPPPPTTASETVLQADLEDANDVEKLDTLPLDDDDDDDISDAPEELSTSTDTDSEDGTPGVL
jgi:hypothetical protein